MPRDTDERQMTRLMLAGLAMSGMASGHNQTPAYGFGGLASTAIDAADALIAKLEEGQKVELEAYQARRVRFGEAFFARLPDKGCPSIEAVRNAWNQACKQVEPEFFGALR